MTRLLESIPVVRKWRLRAVPSIRWVVGAAFVAASCLILITIAPSVAAADSEGTSAAGAVLVDEHFDAQSLPVGWTTLGGSWAVVDGALTGTSRSASALARIDLGIDADNVRLEADVTFSALANTDPRRWFGFASGLSTVQDGPYSVAQIRYGSDAADGIGFLNRAQDGSWESLEHIGSPTPNALGQARHLVVDITGPIATWYVDGAKVLSTADFTSSDGDLGLLVSGATVAVDNLRIASISPPVAGSFPALNVSGSGAIAAAHKGLPRSTPESTLASFQAARALDPEMVEFDVRYTKDGVPVVIHDSSIDRTTDGSGSVSQLTWGEIKDLDAGSWFDPKFSDQRIPTLAEVAEVFSGSNVKLLVDLKTRISLAQATELSSLLARYVDPSAIYLKSYTLVSLKNLRSAAGDMNRVLSMEGYVAPSRTAEQLLADVESVDAVAINIEYWAAATRSDLVSLFHQHAKGVIVWTIDSACEWLGAASLGADVVTTNDLEMFQQWRLGALRGGSAAQRAEGTPVVTGTLKLRAQGVPRGQSALVAIDSVENPVFYTTSDCWGSFDADIDVTPLANSITTSRTAFVLDVNGTIVARFAFHVAAIESSGPSTAAPPPTPGSGQTNPTVEVTAQAEGTDPTVDPGSVVSEVTKPSSDSPRAPRPDISDPEELPLLCGVHNGDWSARQAGSLDLISVAFNNPPPAAGSLSPAVDFPRSHAGIRSVDSAATAWIDNSSPSLSLVLLITIVMSGGVALGGASVATRIASRRTNG